MLGGLTIRRRARTVTPRSMDAYLNLLQEVLDHGAIREDRTEVGTRGVFGRQIRFDLSDGFHAGDHQEDPPEIRNCELLWFLRGDTNVKWLQERGVRIWNEWADEDGNLGPVYGQQWQAFPNPNRAPSTRSPNW